MRSRFWMCQKIHHWFYFLKCLGHQDNHGLATLNRAMPVSQLWCTIDTWLRKLKEKLSKLDQKVDSLRFALPNKLDCGSRQLTFVGPQTDTVWVELSLKICKLSSAKNLRTQTTCFSVIYGYSNELFSHDSPDRLPRNIWAPNLYTFWSGDAVDVHFAISS